MTNRAPAKTPRKRLLLAFALATIVITAAWITQFLINFDLNDYRYHAEEKLSSLLSLPVKIDDIHYNLHETNLALHIAGLQIGDDISNVQINAPDILIDLQWWELLSRDIKFAKINLVEPLIRISVSTELQTGGPSPQGEQTPAMLDYALLQDISIDNLEIVGGTLHLVTPRAGKPTDQIDFTELDGELADIKLGQAAHLSLKGNLRIPGQKKKSPWQLQGESSLRVNESKVLEPNINLDLNVKELDLSAIGAFLIDKAVNCSVEGTGELHLHVEGSPDSNIDFQTELSSSNMSLLPSPAYPRPILLKNLVASGSLQTSGDHPGIKGLSLQVDESRLAGSIGWAPEGQAFSTTITLMNSKLAVSQVKEWLPDDQEAWQAIRREVLDQGTIQIELAEFTLFENKASQRVWRTDQFKGEFRQVTWNHEDTPTLEIISLPFNFANRLWQINNGRGRCGSLQLAINGAGEYNQDGILVTSLDFAGEALSSALLEEWQIPQHSFSADGNLGISAHFEGPLEQLNLDLQANLSQLRVSHPHGLTLSPEPEDKLTVHVTLSPQKISLDHGSIKWSVVKGHISGTFLREDPDSLAIDALLTINDMATLAEALPLLEKLQLHGQADVSISQRGLPADNRPEVILTLRDAGLHATRYIADLNRINGRVHLTPTGLAADSLRVHLGQSPLTVQARLVDFNNPKLLLDVKAPSIRADELIFYSDKVMLRDIDGHLEIDRDGLSFDPVDVRLDGGTKASVRGTISFHAPFAVQLNIASEFARIGEVISLWADRSEASKKRAIPKGNEADQTSPNAVVRIDATVKHGDLYGMSFHDASGLIVPSHHQLSIHPLDFSVGDGFCNAQVIIDFSTERPALLRISGHAEDVDALEVYQELLNQQNIVRGKLRGDFYLSGDIGPGYLPSSYGDFSIQIHDGVLHQFPILSKIFSLLNVSQIFALQLPDMDVEGMPFDFLSANLQIDKGILKSEDLKIQSEAMNQSYTGQLNLINKEVDLSVAIQPLGTVDKIVSHIPIAGWLLTGEDRALLTAHFSVTGKTSDVSVTPMPLDTLIDPTIGLLKRTLELPFKLFEDPQILWGGESSKE